MGLECLILDKEEAEDNKNYNLKVDFDNTLIDQNSGVRLLVAHLAVRLGLNKDIAFKYDNRGTLNELLSWTWDYSKEGITSKKGIINSLDVITDIGGALSTALIYKIGLYKPDKAIKALIKPLESCPLELRDYITDNLTINDKLYTKKGKINTTDIIKGRRLRIKSRNDVNLIKEFVEKNKDFFSIVEGPIQIVANEFEINNNYYTGKIKQLNVYGKEQFHPEKIYIEHKGFIYV
ncbi:MAG: hypothetical protein KAU20_04945 [Nanoarchaeota archaeon]|nr:hypothetical protein [Nanoarchaeota archaeon]